MSHQSTKLSRLAGACALFLSIAALAPASDGPVLKDRDQKELGTAIRALIDAKEGKPAEKAKKTLVDLLTRFGKGLNKKGVDPLQASLSLTADLGRAFYMSEEHELAGLRPGDVAETTFQIPGGDKDQKITFAAWTPKSYKPSNEPMPVILFLPGTKEGKNLSGKQFLIEHWIEGDIRDKAILVAVNMPDDPKIWGEIQTEDGRQGGVSVVMRTLNKIKEMYAVDCDRVYIGGRETGVAAALSIASLYPQVFAAVFGQAGDAGATNWENFRNLPTCFAGGGASATSFEEKTKAAGYANCTLQATGTDADVWTWMQDKRRVSYPAKLTLVPAALGPFRSYWLEIPRQEVAGDLRIEAEYDRASNRLEIKGTNAKQVTVFLNDVMLDLDKPIKVVCNGVEKEEKVSRSLDDTLNFLRRGTSDPGRLYVASRTFDLPKAGKE